MRYCLYAEPEWIKQSYGLNPKMEGRIFWDKLPRLLHSGLTNWARVFEGWYSIPTTAAELNEYDVIHTNMTQHGIGSVKKIKANMKRAGNTNLKVVVNVDHAINMWQAFEPFGTMLEDVNMADHVFCVHPIMADSLGVFLDRKIHVIPHPTSLDMFKEFQQDKFDKPTVTVVSHSYDRNYLIMSEMLIALRKKRPDLQTIFIGKMEDRTYIKWNYDEYFEMVPFPALMRIISASHVIIDTAVTHSYGRVPVECAALGTPCIGGTNIEAVNVLWPDLGVDIFNAKQLSDKVDDMLFGDQECIKAIVDNAQEKVARYGYPESKKAFEVMLAGS